MEELNYETFMIYLRQIQKNMQRNMNEELKKIGITSTHVGILMILKREADGISMSELSRITKVDNALMTRNIKELEKINYIYRDRKKESERKYHICLTKEGYKIAKQLSKIIEEKQQNFLKSLTLEEKEILKKAVTIIIQKFELEMRKEQEKC